MSLFCPLLYITWFNETNYVNNTINNNMHIPGQGSPTTRMQSTIGLWAVCNWDAEVVGEDVHTHPHLCEQQASTHSSCTSSVRVCLPLMQIEQCICVPATHTDPSIPPSLTQSQEGGRTVLGYVYWFNPLNKILPQIHVFQNWKHKRPSCQKLSLHSEKISAACFSLCCL